MALAAVPALASGTVLAAGFAALFGAILSSHCAFAGVPAVHDAGVAGAAEHYPRAEESRQDRPDEEGVSFLRIIIPLLS